MASIREQILNGTYKPTNIQSKPKQVQLPVKKEEKKPSLLGTLKNTGAILTRGVANFGENITDAAFQVFSSKANPFTHLFGADKVQKGAQSVIQENMTDTAMKTYLNIDEEKQRQLDDESLIKTTNLGGKVVQGVGSMLPSILTGNVLGAGIATAQTGAKAFGGGVEQAYREGATRGQATGYGLGNAAVETATEWITGGIPGVKSKWLSGIDKLAEKGINKVSNEVTKSLIKAGYQIIGEGFEEGLAEILNPLVQNATYSKGEKINWEEVIDSAVVGAITGGILNAPSNIANVRQASKVNKVNIPTKADIQTNAQSNVNIPIKQEQASNAPEIKSTEGSKSIKDVLSTINTNIQPFDETIANPKQLQMDIISKSNPMTDDYHTGIRSIDDIKTASEAFTKENFEETSYPDFTFEDSQKAIKEGKITIYSSNPIENGGFVSTSKMMAQDYAGGSKVYSKIVSINEIAWIDNNEGQYAKVEIAPIKQKIIPLEKRISGDELLNAQDLIDEIKNVGGSIDDNGYVTLYHASSLENVKQIYKEGKMSAKEDGLFFSTKKDGQISGYGNAIIELKVPIEKLKLDDIFEDEAHLKIPLKNKDEILNIKNYLVDNSSEKTGFFPPKEVDNTSFFNKENANTNINLPIRKDIPKDPTKESSYDIEPTTAQVRKTKVKEYREQAKKLTQNIADWKDKKRGLNYQVNTMERNIRDIIPNRQEAEQVINTYIRPITKKNAEKERFINQYNEKISDLKLSNKESTAVQMLGEYKHNPETELRWEQVEKYIKDNNLDIKKLEKSVDLFRNTYDELITKANEVLKEQGYKEIEYRKGYFPHFIDDKPNSIIGKMAEKLGWKFNNNKLPTDIAGMTDIFKPGKTWFRSSLRRTGDVTDYNALKGFDNYIRGVSDIIFHTESIQKLRSLENEIRYQYSDKGIQEEIDKINNDKTFTLEEKQENIDKVYERVQNQMPNLVTELRRYTDNLANKKDISDRNMEHSIGREAYNTMTNINNRLAGNMIGLNVSSALTNFIPITQAYSQVSTKNILKATQETMKSFYKDDGFVNESTFLTNRIKQADKLYKTGLEKASDKANMLFEGIDSLTANIVVRSKYLENIDKGMSHQEALSNADTFAKNIIAGRDKGSLPTLFNKKNPLVKLVTTFQLEQANQYGYMFKDLPDDMKKEGTAKLTMAFIKMFFGAWLYNKIKESATGTKAAFSPIDLLEETVETLQNDNLTGTEKVTKTSENIVREAPFVGGLLGGGRLPISAALPNVGTTITSASNIINEEGNQTTAWNNLKKELLKPVAYLVPPFGGGQIKKAVEGLSMYSDNKEVKGSYASSGKLRFPVKEDLGSKIQAGLFGQYSSKEAREYFDNNYAPLGDKQIKEYKELNIPISEYREYRKELPKKVKEKFEYINGLPYNEKQKNIMINNVVSRKDKIDLTDYGKYGSYEEFDYAVRNPAKYNLITKITSYDNYNKYINQIDRVKTKYQDVKSRKNAVVKYVNSLSLNIPQKAMLIKMQYGSYDKYNEQIVKYIQSQKLTKNEKTNILTELGFKVVNGKVRW